MGVVETTEWWDRWPRPFRRADPSRTPLRPSARGLGRRRKRRGPRSGRIARRARRTGASRSTGRSGTAASASRRSRSRRARVSSGSLAIRPPPSRGWVRAVRGRPRAHSPSESDRCPSPRRPRLRTCARSSRGSPMARRSGSSIESAWAARTSSGSSDPATEPTGRPSEARNDVTETQLHDGGQHEPHPPVRREPRPLLERPVERLLRGRRRAFGVPGHEARRSGTRVVVPPRRAPRSRRPEPRGGSGLPGGPRPIVASSPGRGRRTRLP